MNFLQCLDRLVVLWIILIIYSGLQRVDFLHFGHCPYLGVDSTVVQTLNISVQTFCVIGYQKDKRIQISVC